jgi:quinolinate synthase
VHDQFTVNDVTNARQQFPDTLILAHPECRPEVVDAVDFSGSTSKMIEYVQNSNAKSFLLLTECSMADNIAADNPDKEMVGMCSVRCPHMNEITLEDTLNALRNLEQQIEVEETIRVQAKKSLDRMLDF